VALWVGGFPLESFQLEDSLLEDALLEDSLLENALRSAHMVKCHLLQSEKEVATLSTPLKASQPLCLQEIHKAQMIRSEVTTRYLRLERRSCKQRLTLYSKV
jgi:hypothetical protein